ncbi:synaptogyrin-4-like [Corticium candelabrum]|uniref:synaptogyrin-4-like n=1 Tax=Corticium candelabrum TaxID=121492 RepID=UPI002E362392|nr:synaptogyrin-4-like [Corticium candelabrum]
MRNSKSAATRVVLRLFSMAFGVVVLACIADKLFVKASYTKVCIFDLKNSACEFGLACGSLSLILSVVFCTLDCVAFVREIKNPTRQIISVTSGVLDFVMAILWIACFGYLTRTWIDMTKYGYSFSTGTNGRVYATLTFSFLSIPVWIIMAVVDFRNRADLDASRTNQATTVCYPVNPPVYCPGYSPGNSAIVYHPAHPTQSSNCVIQPFVYPPGYPLDHPLAYPAFTMKQ